LCKGGRLVAPVGSTWQELTLIEKKADGTMIRRFAGDVSFVPMKPGGR
jgi:protein-L-isoaspartate O-methyltransferase